VANNIKGITVEINGETGPLQNALKDVNKTSYALKGELKEVEKALKLDPTNVDLLRQKQTLLAESITNTKEKLATLKLAETQAQAAFARGDISAEQYRILQREVVNTQGALNDLESRANTSNGTLKKVAESASKMGDKVIVTGVAAVGTTLAATAVAGVTMGDELQKALNGVQASTGSSDKAMGGMKDTMLAIYNNNFGDDLTDIGVSMAEVGKQTKTSGAELQGLTENALALRDTFGFEVTESTRAATMMMNQFGMTGKESYNLIAQGAQQGLDKNGDLLDSVNEYSTNFKMAGLSSTDMFNMFKNGADGGVISTDKIGDAIKEFGIRSKDMSKGSSDAFKSLGLDATKTSQAFAKGGTDGKKAFEEVTKKLFEMKDPLAQNTTGTALFGSMWEDVGAKGIKALTNTKGGIDTTKDALKGINDVKYNSLGEGIDGIKRQLITGLALPIGQDLLPKMNEFSGELKEKMPGAIATLKPIIESLIDKVVFLASHLNIIIPIITGVVAALITMSIINKIVQFYGALTKVMGLVSLAKLKDIGQTITLNALYAKDAILRGAGMVGEFTKSLVLLSIGKLKDIGQTITLNALYAKDAILRGAGMVGEFTKSLVLLSIGKLKDIAQTTILGALYAKDAIIRGASTIAQIALTVATVAWNIVCGIATAVTTGLGVAFTFLTSPIGLVILAIAALIAIGVLLYKNWDLIMAKAAPIFEGIKTIIVLIFTAIGLFISTIWAGIKTFLVATFIIIKTLFTLYVTAWMIIIQTIFNVIKTIISTILNVITTVITTAFTIIKTLFTIYVTSWMIVIQTIFNVIKTIVTSAVNFINSTISGVWNAIKNTTTNVWNGIKNAITTSITAAQNIALGVVNNIKSFFNNLHVNIPGISGNPFTAIANLASSAVNKIRNFFSGLKLKLPSISIPNIKLPHFSINGAFSLLPPKVPSLGVDWYDKGGIFDTPNIIGVGEKRPEFVGALDDLREIVRSEFNKIAGNSGGSQTTIMQVSLEGKVIATATAPYSDRISGNNINLMNRGLIV